jgi:hypothetical protein
MGSGDGACRRKVNFLMNKLLTAYWIELDSYFKNIGVTGYSLDDAKRLIQEKAFPKEELPRIIKITENIQFKDLDQNHIVPNMGPITERGVWYPNFYSY